MRTGTVAATDRLAPPSAATPAVPPAAPGRSSAPGGLVPGELVLGRYVLVRVLGRGGAGTVWEALDRQLGRPVAVKCLPADGRGKALGEARAAARLGHPAVVSVYALGAAAGHVWLVTELVAGDTLRRTIADDTHSDEELLQIGVSLCAALRHAHGRGIVHRDVTPRNVLVPHGAFRVDGAGGTRCDPGVAPAKLADFGIARLAATETAPTPPGEPPRIVGTLAYMSPERLEGGPGDAAGDLWALAVVLHEALTGEHPAGSTTGKPASALLVAHRDLPSLRLRRPDLEPDLVAAIDRAAAEDPAARGTVAELEAALMSALEQRGVAVAPAVADPARALPRRPAPIAGPSPAIHVHVARPRPALVPVVPVAAAAGAALGPLAVPVAALLGAAAIVGARRATAHAHGRRIAAGVLLLALVLAVAAGAASVLRAAGAPAGPALPLVALLLATGAVVARSPSTAAAAPTPRRAPRTP
ncbi:serine/threonine-protein kinase [Patulibacter brassicae]|uniref:non-specific serine/threonine protein kinase n=1 Tax=Patulibacter brassicae TaxID=1705717 RepID=A0ABU4VKS3_9ACTN|nr:serine/threonine-protein kinase [Patulibacter brassicae]MDX8152454.1 serine/threonine-protein kinase [Patulibacter brassicae]